MSKTKNSGVYKNDNGKKYVIIEQDRDMVLLVDFDMQAHGRFIVATGFNHEISSWGEGHYFKDMLEAKDYYENITENWKGE